MMVASNQRAPGDLEQVRNLLNSWLIPNDVRVPADRFDDFVKDRGIDDAKQASRLRRLRDVLRAAVEREVGAEGSLNESIARFRLHPLVTDRGTLDFLHDGSPAGALLSVVLSAIQQGTWARLKACPECRWVFFDHTRNGKKRWCLMNAGGPTGRACGTLDKVRRFRARHRTEGPR